MINNTMKRSKKNEVMEDLMMAFGPVPSRRLGRSLGINNIPPKICTYSCIYCQLGRTRNMQIERKQFYRPEEIMESVEERIKNARERGETIDYLTFVPDGEPTLDIDLGKEIELLKRFNIKIAVISNASLIWREDVKDDLNKADWVSLKIDAASENIWRRMDRPHGALELERILEGISDFSRAFKGELVTETMLIRGVNDDTEEISRIAEFIGRINPDKSYLSIPTRPPAEKWVESATEESINRTYQIFTENSIDVQHLIGYEGNEFAFTGNVEEDLLSITSVHPMMGDAVKEYLAKANAEWDIIENLMNENRLVEVEYNNNKFYMRRFGG